MITPKFIINNQKLVRIINRQRKPQNIEIRIEPQTPNFDFYSGLTPIIGGIGSYIAFCIITNDYFNKVY